MNAADCSNLLTPSASNGVGSQALPLVLCRLLTAAVHTRQGGLSHLRKVLLCATYMPRQLRQLSVLDKKRVDMMAQPAPWYHVDLAAALGPL